MKLEGGEEVAALVARLVAAGIPVMGHVGLTPQSLHQLGGFKVQGRPRPARRRSWPTRAPLADAGAYAMVLEGMPGRAGAPR